MWRTLCDCGRESMCRTDGLTGGCRQCSQDKGLEIGRKKVSDGSKAKAHAVKISGMKYCFACSTLIPVGSFQKSAKAPDGLQPSCRECCYFKQIKHHYGLAKEAYLKMWEAQEGKCAVRGCGSNIEVVDHCHASGVVRGLLCQRCNRALPHYFDADRLRALAEYIDKANRVMSEEHLLSA